MSGRRRRDPCWKYFIEEKTNNSTIAICKFCGRRYGGITIAKRHIIGGFAAVTSCKEAPSQVKLEIQNYMNVKNRDTNKIQTQAGYITYMSSSGTSKMNKVQSFDQIMENVKQEVVVIDDDDDDDDGLVNVNGYKVKPKIAPILEDIFAKYGDITSRCLYKSIYMRTHLLELICKLVQKLQNPDLEAILSDLDSIQKELSDVQTSRIEVSWLSEHLAAVRKLAATKDKHLQLKKLKAIFGFVIDAAKREKKLRLTQLLKKDMFLGDLKRFRDARELYFAAKRRAEALEVFDKKLYDYIMECAEEIILGLHDLP